MSSINPELFRALPKAEIHVHLEGCFNVETLVRWAGEAGVLLPRPADRLFEFQGLADFLHFLDWACGLASSPQRLTELAHDFCRRLAADGTGYADLIVNPTHWKHWRHRIPEMVAALDDGFAAAEAEGLPPVGLCISLLRTQTDKEANDLVDLLVTMGHPRVVALSIDGNEAAAGRTGERFAAAFEKAGKAGLKRTAHAGESSGPEGVRDAILLLGVDRIDHGVRAIADDATVELLVERRVPIGVCPTSNINLKIFPSIAEHPIDRLVREGVRVSINTDDPSLMGTNLPLEYARVASAFSWDESVIRDVARTSIEASFASESVKAGLLARLATWQESPGP